MTAQLPLSNYRTRRLSELTARVQGYFQAQDDLDFEVEVVYIFFFFELRGEAVQTVAVCFLLTLVHHAATATTSCHSCRRK
jgi:hypothetical protein